MSGVAALPRGAAGRTVARLQARWRRSELDAQLAEGRSPWSSPALLARAEQLVSPAHRRRVAAALRAMIDLAEYPRPASPAVRLRADAIRRHRAAIRALADRLDQATPVDVAVVARLSLLAWDGSSPVLTTGRPAGELRDTLARCMAQLVD